MGTIYIAMGLFGITTIMGMYLSSLVLRNKETPKAIIIIHGLVTIAGFSILFSYYPASLKSLFFFSVATLCGLILLYQDLTGKFFSKWLCFAHGILTIVGFVFLLGLVFSQ